METLDDPRSQEAVDVAPQGVLGDAGRIADLGRRGCALVIDDAQNLIRARGNRPTGLARVLRVAQ